MGGLAATKRELPCKSLSGPRQNVAGWTFCCVKDTDLSRTLRKSSGAAYPAQTYTERPLPGEPWLAAARWPTAGDPVFQLQDFTKACTCQTERIAM